MIDFALNRQQADELFDNEAILFGKTNGVPEFRMVELFGEWAGAFFEKHVHYNGYMIGGEDWNAWGNCTPERPMLNYLYRSGFLKIVTEHNYRQSLANHKASDGGRVVDVLWQERSERIAAQDAEEERKRAERKAKREAVRRAKQEVQNSQEVEV